MNFEKLFKLKENPFRMTPAVSSDEIIWAGFPQIKEKFENRIKRSIKMTNSGLILNWGEYGSGKTHAARYFNKKDVLLKISKEVNAKCPYSLVFSLPKGKNPVYDMFVSIIDKIDFESIREIFKSETKNIITFIDSFSDNLHIKNVLKAIFTDADSLLLKRYFYGNLTATELRNLNDYGILRNLNSDSDYTKILSGFFNCLTHNKVYYSSVIIWIDEFEDIAILSNINVDKTNNFIRELLDNTPNNLLLFLNLTQTALLNFQDLGQYLSEAIRSRIKDRIQFDLPSKDDLKLYLMELLNHEIFRTENVDNPLFPFNDEVVDVLINELKNASLRRYNEAFSMLLDIAELEGSSPITKKIFEENKNEIIGWKE